MKVQRDNPAEKEARLDWMLEENRVATEASRERAQAARDAAKRHATGRPRTFIAPDLALN
jgi:hypothetical protein